VRGCLIAARRAALSPADLIDLLRNTARNPLGPGWNDRFGSGIIEVKAALNAGLGVGS
jgi:hypothetical protein